MLQPPQTASILRSFFDLRHSNRIPFNLPVDLDFVVQVVLGIRFSRELIDLVVSFANEDGCGSALNATLGAFPRLRAASGI